MRETWLLTSNYAGATESKATKDNSGDSGRRDYD